MLVHDLGAGTGEHGSACEGTAVVIVQSVTAVCV